MSDPGAVLRRERFDPTASLNEDRMNGAREQRLLFEIRSENPGGHVPSADPDFGPEKVLNQRYLRKAPAALPSLSEPEVARHFTLLSRKNFCVDTNFYPLGSCTMKYNPKINDHVSSWPCFARLHPYQDDSQVQGVLEILEETEKALCECAGMDAFTLQPAAGAQGEMTGLLMIKAYHDSTRSGRNQVLVPDSAHGTNPASAALCGYEVVQVRTDAHGRVDLDDLKQKAGDKTACFMLTNPNTLGIFEKGITQISQTVHRAGGLVYFDGANMNALLGIVRPGDMGFDVVHVNLHKTFSVPHGGGGPGSGPVGVKKNLEKFLPLPRLLRTPDGLQWHADRPHSIGRLRSFYGNIGAILRAWCYIRLLGGPGLRRVAEDAILNANYVKKRLAGSYNMPHSSYCMHEFVLSATKQKERGVRALDIAKRLLDFGIHAPTIYFPLIVEEAMMVEPTETESMQTLDEFIRVMKTIDAETISCPDKVLGAPWTTPVSRIDEVLAARQPNLRWTDPK